MGQCTYRSASPNPRHTCWSAFFQAAVAMRAVQGRLPRAYDNRDQAELARIREDMARVVPPYLRHFRIPCTFDDRACSQIP